MCTMQPYTLLGLPCSCLGYTRYLGLGNYNIFSFPCRTKSTLVSGMALETLIDQVTHDVFYLGPDDIHHSLR